MIASVWDTALALLNMYFMHEMKQLYKERTVAAAFSEVHYEHIKHLESSMSTFSGI